MFPLVAYRAHISRKPEPQSADCRRRVHVRHEVVDALLGIRMILLVVSPAPGRQNAEATMGTNHYYGLAIPIYTHI